jgi:uncharacterized NAD(P)/FAD-binding protein YdhS
MRTVAIIGGGFSGTTLAATLLARSEAPIEVLLFERRGTFGAGVAYGTLDGHHWLNVPSAGMSAFEDQPDHFVRWLCEHGAEREGNFATRATYGRYLAALLKLPPRHPDSKLRTINREVILIEDDGCLRTKGGGSHEAEILVLATGYLPESKFGVVNTWPDKGVENAVVIGSSLSALDAAASILSRYPQARVVCVSRHGMLPRPFEEAPPRPLSSPFPTGSVRLIFRWLRHEIARAEVEGAGWTSVFEAMRPHWETLWQGLDDRDRARFRSHLARRFECFRHRIPPPLQRFLAPYLLSGALTVLRDHVLEQGGNSVRLRSGRSLTADMVLDASGPVWNWRESSEPLYRQLFETGAVGAGPGGIGLQADEAGWLGGRLYTVGPPLRGVKWETTAVREIRRQVQSIAEAILATPPYHSPRLENGRASSGGEAAKLA